MEDKPTTQAGRDVPRSRTPRTAVSKSDEPAAPSKPVERAPRRAKAAPPVTFQAPSHQAGSDSGTGSSSPDATTGPAPSEAATGNRRKPAQRRSQPPAKTTAADSTAPAKRSRAKAEPDSPAKATPAKKATRVPAQPATSEVATSMPSSKTPRAKKAAKATRAKATSRPDTTDPESVDAVPAQAVADATPPAKAMPAAADPIDDAPAGDQRGEVHADDPAPAQPIADATPPAKAAPVAEQPAPPTSDPTPPAKTAPLTEQPAQQGQLAAPAGTEQRRPGAFAKLAADPGHAPELLALSAVQMIGPRAAEWAKRTREAYPTATDAGLARLAVREFTRLGSGSSIVGAVAGAYAPAALVATAVLTQARLILHVAAAYGLDPTDEARAADLLVLTRVHGSQDDAAAALAGAKHGNRDAHPGAARRLGRMAAAQAAGWAVVKLANRYFPGTNLLVAALANRTAVKGMADRAISYYSQDSHALGSSV